jgi:hypothetical protein
MTTRILRVLGITALAVTVLASAAEVSPAGAFSKVPVGAAIQKGKVVLGNLGQAKEACQIYFKPDSHSKVAFSLKGGEHLVVRQLDTDWTKILLQNGTYGYAVSSKVAKLPYLVTRSQAVVASHSGSSNVAAQLALQYVGQPTSKALRGGGLVSAAFGAAGTSLPSALSRQVAIGKPVTRLEELKSGDRVYFWNKSTNKLGFAGIYVGNGYIVAPFPGESTISTRYMGEKKWLNQLVAARRKRPPAIVYIVLRRDPAAG